MSKSKYIILLIAVFSGVACTKTIEESIPEIESIVRENNLVSSDYKVSDFGKSSYYWVNHAGNVYIARMPIVVDTLLSLKLLPDSLTMEQNKGKDLTKHIPLHCKEAEEIKDICLLFRQIWQTNPKEILLKSMQISDKKDVTLLIESKTTKENYCIEIEHYTHEARYYKYNSSKNSSNGKLLSVFKYFNLYKCLKERASKTPDIRLGKFILMNERSIKKTVGNLMENLDYEADSSTVVFKNTAGEFLELTYYHGDPDNIFRKFRVFQYYNGEDAKNIDMEYVTESGVRLRMTSEELLEKKRGCIRSITIDEDGRKEYIIRIQEYSHPKRYNVQEYYARYVFNEEDMLIEFEFCLKDA